MLALLSMLADITPQDAGMLIATILGSGACGYGFHKIKSVSVGPQPFITQRLKEYATKKELDDLRQECKTELRAIDARVDTITPMMGEIKGKLDGLEKTNRQILETLLKK